MSFNINFIAHKNVDFFQPDGCGQKWQTLMRNHQVAANIFKLNRSSWSKLFSISDAYATLVLSFSLSSHKTKILNDIWNNCTKNKKKLLLHFVFFSFFFLHSAWSLYRKWSVFIIFLCCILCALVSSFSAISALSFESAPLFYAYYCCILHASTFVINHFNLIFIL